MLAAASLRRSAAAKSNNASAFHGIDDSNGIDDGNNDNDRSILDSLEMESVMNDDAAIVEVVDENNNGTFIDGIDYRFRWKNWSNRFVVPPSF